MTLHEAAEQALEDLENEIFSGDWCECDYKVHHHDCSLGQIIKTLRAALAEPDGWRQCEEAVEAAKDEAYSRGIDAGWALAQQSKAVQEKNSGYTEEYATNVAAHARREEREACAKVVENLYCGIQIEYGMPKIQDMCAAAIRARSEQ